MTAGREKERKREMTTSTGTEREIEREMKTGKER